MRELNEMNSKRTKCAKDRVEIMKEIEAVRKDIQAARDELSSQGKSIRGI